MQTANSEVKHYKVIELPTRPRPNTVYYVKDSSETDVKTYITDLNGVPVPLNDEIGDIVGDKNFEHIQLSASNTWEIVHNLNKYVSVTIVDSGNNMVVGDIEYESPNKVIIRFQASFSGRAYLN
jgi:hypothetical protein